LLSEMDWLLRANMGAKVSITRDSCPYAMGTKATGRTITRRYATGAWFDPERPQEKEGGG
jgi:hypothetical protein